MMPPCNPAENPAPLNSIPLGRFNQIPQSRYRQRTLDTTDTHLMDGCQKCRRKKKRQRAAQFD